MRTKFSVFAFIAMLAMSINSCGGGSSVVRDFSAPGGKTPTTTTVVASPDPAEPGVDVTFDISVSPNAAGGKATVMISYDGGATYVNATGGTGVPVVAGAGTFVLVGGFAAVGSYPYYAHYMPSTGSPYGQSKSGTSILVVEESCVESATCLFNTNTVDLYDELNPDFYHAGTSGGTHLFQVTFTNEGAADDFAIGGSIGGGYTIVGSISGTSGSPASSGQSWNVHLDECESVTVYLTVTGTSTSNSKLIHGGWTVKDSTNTILYKFEAVKQLN